MKYLSRIDKRIGSSVPAIFAVLVVLALILLVIFYGMYHLYRSNQEKDISHDVVKEYDGAAISLFDTDNEAKESDLSVDKQIVISNVKVIFFDLGLNERLVKKITSLLPENFAIGLSAYSKNLEGSIDYLKSKGRVVLVGIPMETYDDYFEDNGPAALISKLDNKENHKRLSWIMSRSLKADGFYTQVNESFTDRSDNLLFLLTEVKKTGKTLFYNDQGNDKLFSNIAKALSIDDKVLRCNIVINDAYYNSSKQLDLLLKRGADEKDLIFLIKQSEKNLQLIKKFIRNADPDKFKITDILSD